MKKLWPKQVGKKKTTEHKLCRDKANNKARNFVAKNLDYVPTKLEDKFFHDKVLLCSNKAKDKPKKNFVATKFYFVSTKF